MHELLFISGSSKVVKITGIAKAGRTVSIIVRGSNKLMLEEAARSLHDALCVIRCLVKKRFIIAGGGSPGTNMLCCSIMLCCHGEFTKITQ